MFSQTSMSDVFTCIVKNAGLGTSLAKAKLELSDAMNLFFGGGEACGPAHSAVRGSCHVAARWLRLAWLCAFGETTCGVWCMLRVHCTSSVDSFEVLCLYVNKFFGAQAETLCTLERCILLAA